MLPNIDKFLSYEEYQREAEILADKPFDPNENEIAIKRNSTRKLNLARTKRIEKQYEPSDRIKSIINEIDEEQTWLVITESWCGDSAQNLPYIAKIAELNNKIKLKIIYRDENPDIMDKYLTDGNRSIPKLVAFDKDDNELFHWGPRPQSAQELVKELKGEGVDAEERNKQLHTWYAKNKGEELEQEFIIILMEVFV